MPTLHCPECGATGPARPTVAEVEADCAWHDHHLHGDRPTAAVAAPVAAR